MILRIILSVGALLLSVALLQAGNGLQGTLLPLRAATESFSTFSIALLGSTYFVGFICGCLYGQKLVNLVGHIRVFTAMAALASATPLAHGLLLDPAPWWILRVLTGFCFAVLYIVIESWLNEQSTKETRGTIFAIYLIINMTLMTLGQLLLLKFDTNGLVLFAIASILISIAVVPVALSKSPGPSLLPNKSKINILKIYRISPVGVIGCFCAGGVAGSFWALAPQYASRIGFDVPGIALFMSITVIAGAIGQGPIGLLSDRFDRRKVMAIVSTTAGIVGGLMSVYSTAGVVSPYIFAAFWGAFTFPIYGLAAAHTNDFAQPDQFVEVSSALLLIYATGAIIGPLITALLMTSISAPALYGFAASCQLSLVIFILWRSTRREATPEAEHVRYIDALEAVQSVSSVIDETVQVDLIEAMDSANNLSSSKTE